MIRRQLFTGIATAVLALGTAVHPAAARQQAELKVPVSVLERYVGEYDQNGTTVTVGLSGGTLFREVPGQRVVLVPISETLFRMGPVFTAEFVTDRTGAMTQVISDGVMVEYRLPRKGAGTAAPPSPPPAPVRVPRSVLERYAGTYEFLPGQMGRTDLRVVVRLRGNTLTRSVGARDLVLVPISEFRFMVENTSLVTEFVVDEAGVTQVMGSGFQQLLARLRPEG